MFLIFYPLGQAYLAVRAQGALKSRLLSVLVGDKVKKTALSFSNMELLFDRRASIYYSCSYYSL